VAVFDWRVAGLYPLAAAQNKKPPSVDGGMVGVKRCERLVPRAGMKSLP
jgi:hypothetical protein